MANVFTITTAQQTVKANENGQAAAAFTVTNATSRPLRCLVKIRPLSGTQAEWLTIEGETERDFPAGGTHQFSVAFSKPKSAATTPNATPAAESFPFRLDAISAANPDEDFTEGPVVTVEVPAPPPPAPKKSFPWWILIIVGVLLLVGIVVAFLLLRNSGRNDGGNANANANANVTANAATPEPTATPRRRPTIQLPKIVRMSPKEYGVDRRGSDFKYFVAPSLQDCENACRETAECKAFTYGNDKYCWLKNTVPAPASNPNFISGYKLPAE